MSIKPEILKVEVERWLSGLEHQPELLLERTQVGFSAPTCWLTTICNSSFKESDALFWLSLAPGTHVMHECTYSANTHTYKRNKCKILFQFDLVWVLVLVFWDNVFLYSSGCPDSLCRPNCPQTRDLPSWVLGLKHAPPHLAFFQLLKRVLKVKNFRLQKFFFTCFSCRLPHRYTSSFPWLLPSAVFLWCYWMIIDMLLKVLAFVTVIL